MRAVNIIPKSFAWLGALIVGLPLMLATLAGAGIPAAKASPDFANCTFWSVWNYADRYVENNAKPGRSFTWGPGTFGTFEEPYREAKDGQRLVQYFEKARLELIPKNGNAPESYSLGLLTKELISGNVQEGDNTFHPTTPSPLLMVGDQVANNPSPSYASFGLVSSLAPGANYQPNAVNQIVNQAIDHNGQVSTLAEPPVKVTIGGYDATLGHNVPQIFLDFMKQQGPVWEDGGFENGPVYSAQPVSFFGLPISEAFWTRAIVGGQEKDVLVQAFERRVLTFTPSNPAGWQVEMANLGQHYFMWRYHGEVGQPVNGCANPPVVQKPPTEKPQPDKVNCRVVKCIALTFDDGPGAGTKQVLDTLESRKVRATFFLVGQQVPGQGAILKRSLAMGNELANHSWNHSDFTKLSRSQIQAQINQTQAAIKNATGYTPKLYRPPYGATNAAVRDAAGLKEVLWDVDPLDWKDRNSATVQQRVLSGAHRNAIVLMHDIHPTTAAAVAPIIDRLKADGYTLVTVSELLATR